MEYALGDFSLISLTGFTHYRYDDDLDVDFSPIPLLFQRENQEFSQFSQEIRLLSADTAPYKYLIGAYYQGEHLDNVKHIDINLTSIGRPLPSFTRQVDFDQNSWTGALFARSSYKITDKLVLSAGMRYAYEEKEADQHLQFNKFKTKFRNPGSEAGYQAAGLGVAHSLKDKITDAYFTPSASLQYYLFDKTMLYASYAEGDKSGGFNEAETSGNPENFEFGPEHSRTFEIGAKNSFLNGDAYFNLNLFETRYKDLQVSEFEGVDFVVGNASKATSKGVEIEAGWQIIEGLRISGNFNLLDSTYDSFRNATCTIAQTQTSGLGPACNQDLSGKTTQFAPDYSGAIRLDYRRTIPGGMALTAQVDTPFTDGFYVTEDLDQATYQSGFLKLNARVGLSSTDGQWEVAVIGRNLTDKLTISHGDDVPLLGGAFFGLTERPRTIAFEATVRFE